MHASHPLLGRRACKSDLGIAILNARNRELPSPPPPLSVLLPLRCRHLGLSRTPLALALVRRIAFSFAGNWVERSNCLGRAAEAGGPGRLIPDLNKVRAVLPFCGLVVVVASAGCSVDAAAAG